MKEHRARAPADVAPRLLHSTRHGRAVPRTVKTACEKLFPVSSSMFLRFQHLAEPGVRGRRAKQMQAPHVDSAPITRAADAATLHVLTICYRAAATGADSKEEASLLINFTKLLMPLDESVATTGRRAGDGCSAKVANHRFTVLSPWYELSEARIYALGRSGGARRICMFSQPLPTVPP